MVYRDPNKEKAYQDKKENQLTLKSETVTTMRKQTYNIISHEGGGLRKVDIIRRDRRPAPTATNVVSNLPLSDHEHAPLLYDEEYTLTRFRPPTERAKTTIAKPREFNIISNNYCKDHERRRYEDHENLRVKLADKYWKTHDYDLVKARYFDSEKESTLKEQSETLKYAHGRAQEARLPPSLKYADGKSFNIITNDISDAEGLHASMTVTNRSVNRMNKMEKESVIKDERELRAALEEKLRMNKISFKNWETTIDRGYNVVTNEPVVSSPAPLPNRPATMWARLSMPANNNSLHDSINAQSQNFQINSNRLPSVNQSNNVNRAEEDSSRSTSRVRNLSGQGSRYSSSTSDLHENTNAFNFSKPATALGTERSSTTKGVPSLNLAKTNYGEPVSYSEPPKGAPSLTIPIVRTGGGLSSY
jgi:hypothetical protein